MSKSINVTVRTFPAFVVVFLVFLLLKVFHVVDWSWWIVTAPLWWGWALYLGVLAIVIVGGAALVGIVALFEWLQRR